MRRLSRFILRKGALNVSSCFQAITWKRSVEPRIAVKRGIDGTQWPVRTFASKFVDNIGLNFDFDVSFAVAKKPITRNKTPEDIQRKLLELEQLQEKFRLAVQSVLNTSLPCSNPQTAVLSIRNFFHEYLMLHKSERLHLELDVQGLTHSALRKSFDILEDIIQQKSLAVASNVVKVDAIYSQSDYDSDDEDKDIRWCYDARILFNPLLQIWHHISLAPPLAPPSDATFTPDQVREKLQSMIRHVIDLTARTNPSLLVQHVPHQSNNPRNVDYKFFYNSVTLNMMYEVLLHQYVPQKEQAAEILQRYLTEINEHIMSSLQPHFPPGEDDVVPEEETVVDPVLDKLKEDDEELAHMWECDREDYVLHRDLDARPTDERGNIIIKDETNTDVPIDKKKLIDTSGLGILFRPDLNTYHIFMRAWATQCSDLTVASHHVKKIFDQMHRAGRELTPTKETYSIVMQFYSNHPDRFVNKLSHLIQQLIDKEGVRNVELIHWYYAIIGFTKASKHKFKAKEYWEYMMYSSHHHPGENRTIAPGNPKFVFLKKDGHDIESISLLQKAAQHLMGMFRNQVVHYLQVSRSTRHMSPDQGPKTLESAQQEIEIAMRSGVDTYTKLKDSGLLEYVIDDENLSLVYRDNIRTSLLEIFAYAGQLDHAMVTFHVLEYKSAQQYHTLIDAYGKYDNITGAEDIYKMMIKDPNIAYPTMDVFAALLCGYADSTKHPPEMIVDSMVGIINRLAQEEKCIQHGIRPDRNIYYVLLKSLSSLPSTCDAYRCEKAISILDKLEENMQVYNPLNDDDAAAAQVVIPDKSTYLAVLKICLQGRDFDRAISIVQRMAQTPIPAPVPKKRFLNFMTSFEVFQIYRELQTVEGFKKMIDLLNIMNEWSGKGYIPFRPTASAYNVILQTGCDVRNQDSETVGTMMKELFNQMRDSEVQATNSTYIALIEFLCQSEEKKELNLALELYNEYDRITHTFQKSDERMFNALTNGFLRLGETSIAAQVLFWHVKAFLDGRIGVRPVGSIYRKIILSYMKSEEFIKATTFVEQVHILQKGKRPREDVKGVTVKLDERGIPNHIGPDLVTIDELYKAIKTAKSIKLNDRNMCRTMLKKNMEAIKVFHKRRQKIVRESF